MGVKAVPISYEIAGRRRRVTIPDALDMEIEAVPAARPDEVATLVNDPRSGERGYTPRTIARTVTHKFSDYSLFWDNTGKNGYYAPVEMFGP